MKVLFYCSKFPPQAGGAGIDAYHLGKDLSEANHQVFVVCEHAPGLKKYEKFNDSYFVHRVKVPFIKNRGSGIYFIALCVGIACKGIWLILRKKPNILHCHDTATGIGGLITKIITRKKTIFKFGGSMTYEYLCNSNKNGWDPTVGESWAWEHATGMAKLILFVEKQFYLKFDRIYPIAQYLVDILKKYLNVNAKKIKLIHNGVDTNLLKKENFKNIKDELSFKRYIFTGIRFVKYKGVHILIEACQPILEKLDAHLIIAGDGPEENALQKLANGNPRVIFTGNLSWEENINYVRSADVFVLPTLVDKTPSCLMEALALEVPCITSDIDGVKELITPGGGLLVESNNPKALADKISWLLSHPQEAKQMGQVGRKYIVAEFQWNRTREQIEQLYTELDSQQEINSNEKIYEPSQHNPTPVNPVKN